MTPLPAATVILVRDARAHPEVLLLRRQPRASFMPHLHVFPGGRIDDDDALVHPVASAARPHGVSDPEAPVLLRHPHAPAVAAARECFEEAGVLLAGGPGGSAGVHDPAVLASARELLHAGGRPFHGLCRELGWDLVLGELAPVARWITPAGERRRFDTLFFLARVPAGSAAVCDGAETIDECWLTAPEALARHAAGALPLAPPTWAVLRDLAALGTAEEVQAWADARRPWPILPAFGVDEEGEPVLLLPGDRLCPRPPGCGADPAHPGGVTRVRGSAQGWVGEACPG
ncbi:MAG: NUDIX hydrolase [Deltaproteobacteria bacterium]|nr:MAG: NUDIX hydrolase [Deltaproteobacteria bacterium]